MKTASGKVVTPSATSVLLGPGSYTVTTTINFWYLSGGKKATKTAAKTQKLLISVKAPSVYPKVIPNYTVASSAAKVRVFPAYSKDAAAVLSSTRLTVKTASGKVVTPSATSVLLGPGSYTVTDTINFWYPSGGKKVTKTAAKTQKLLISVKAPAAAPKPGSLTYSSSDTASVIKAFNSARVAAGKPGFKSNAKLTTMNQTRTASRYKTHTNFSSVPGVLFAVSHDGYSRNLSLEFAINELLTDPKARAAIRDADFTTLAVAVYTEGSERYVGVIFAGLMS
ncbi:hypothetical protein CVV68_16865 [Arthrobacter livingstonensis]|uniref:Uncharacterized protein n=1 Tax=Arthrobacter livingstonensis TaxID=670078 RepID=A0A2V5L384_9MICC|nr:hypothetical protein CVV68_16865 [Arthrobacter livingstonensis]